MTPGTRRSGVRVKRALLTVPAVLMSMAVLTSWAPAAAGQPGRASATSENERPAGYRVAEEARAIEGELSSADAPRIEPGKYRDSIRPGETLYYSLAMDAETSVFLSAVAAPAPGTKVSYRDGIETVLQTTGGDDCSDHRATFGDDNAARPIASWSTRPIGGDFDCQDPGVYLFSVTRASEPTSNPAPWPLEISYMAEPAVRGGSTAPPAEEGYATEPPVPPASAPKRVAGGTGFNDARSVTNGVWKDRIVPAETRFYRVPVDWGQRLAITVELANAPAKENGSSYASDGLLVALYNTVRGGPVFSDTQAYDGQGARAEVFTPPAAYRNRFGYDDQAVGAMRFSGWYYLAVTLHPEVADVVKGPVGLTLRTTVLGEPAAGPEYRGDAAEAGFGVTEADRKQAAEQLTAVEARQQPGARRTLIAWAGIGTGVALLLALGGWMLVARLRATERLGAGGSLDAAGHR